MERRMLLAIVLSFIVVFLSNYFMTKDAPQKPPVTQQQKVVDEAASPADAGIPEERAHIEDQAHEPPPENLSDITVNTKYFSAVFTNFGGRLKSLKLHEYKLEQTEYSELIDIVTVPELKLLPLDVHFFTTQNVKSLTGNELYSFNTANIDTVKDPSNNRLVFSCLTEDGLQINKIFTFSNDKYNVDLMVEIKNTTQGVITGKMNVNWTELFIRDKKDRSATYETFAFHGKKTERSASKDIDKQYSVISGDIKWSGFNKKFFMVAFVPSDPSNGAFYAEKIKDGHLMRVAKSSFPNEDLISKLLGEKIIVEDGSDKDYVYFNRSIETKDQLVNRLKEIGISKNEPVLAIWQQSFYLTRMTTGNITIHAGDTARVDYRVYMGPQKSENLKEYGVGLQGAINYGFFSIIAVPIMEALKFFYKYTHNYGIAIIIITVIIKLLFYPLTQKSYKAMKDMQKVAPLVNELKEKYKNDKEKLNKEVLELYRRHRVNPVGGCLPMILQMPVFFALYKILLHSVELRHAPFYFWLTDLSSKDPYYITPVIMGATMFIQQKMSPSTGDKTQQKMMFIMPVVFTFMFANFPSGLVIYWLVNNVLSIIQQGNVNKSLSTG